MRLFLALPLEKSTRTQLEKTLTDLRKAGVKGNYTHTENLHLTLHFLGEQPPNAVNAIERAVLSCELKEIPLTIEDMGAFDKTGVLWAGVNPTEELCDFQRELGKALIREGFNLEKRPYRPHLTLVREFELPYDFEPPYLKPITQTAKEVVLFESKREGGRLKYVPKFSLPLEDDEMSY